MSGLRIIAGSLRGRRLPLPGDERVRPVTHKVREAVFSILGETVPDARVLDCFAGAGSYGLEAVSRDAAHATFIEINRYTAMALRRTIADFAVDDRCQVLVGDFRLHARKLVKQQRTFDLVFIDPPFIEHYYHLIFHHPFFRPLFGPSSLGMLEFPLRWKAAVLARADEGGFSVADERTYGNTGIAFIHRRNDGYDDDAASRDAGHDEDRAGNPSDDGE